MRAAHQDRSTLAQEVANAVVSLAPQPPDLGHDLSPREQEVLTLLVEGLSNAQIAERLTISQATVKYHVRVKLF